MKKILLYIWQLPQNLLGLLVIKVTRAKPSTDFVDKDMLYYKSMLDHCSFGVCLGEYIIFGAYTACIMGWRHESGHRLQSRMLGPLYLFVVGLPSVARNIWDRVVHWSWGFDRRKRWYYGGYPENWADRLVGIKRRSI